MRFQRQTTIIGEQGQDTLNKAHITIVGLGALGSVSAELLTRAGIGSLTLIDKDLVELTNLQRQSLYTEKDIGKPKTQSLSKHLKTINKDTKTKIVTESLGTDNPHILTNPTLILDCTDNMTTRFLINEYCKKNAIPWIHAAAVKTQGTILNILPSTPCLRCIFPKLPKDQSCEQLGILNSTSHLVASIQVSEALKILLNNNPESTLLRINTETNEIQKIKIKPDPKCPVCNGSYKLITTTKVKDIQGPIEFTIKKCKTKAAYTTIPKKRIRLNLNKIKKQYTTILDTPIVIVIKTPHTEIVIHQHGELKFKSLDNQDQITKLAKEVYDASFD